MLSHLDLSRGEGGTTGTRQISKLFLHSNAALAQRLSGAASGPEQWLVNDKKIKIKNKNNASGAEQWLVS